MHAFRGFVATVIVVSSIPLVAAEKFRLAENGQSEATWTVETKISGSGTLEFQPGPNADRPITHPIKINASFRFFERRLPAAGREDAAWRSLRHYEEAKSSIDVGGQTSSPELSENRRRIVVQADRAGLVPYSPNGALTSQEVELLPSLGDVLLLTAMLPGREISIGESWTPQPWIGPALAGTEVSFNSGLTCRLESVDAGIAKVSFEGKVSGAAKGATSETTLNGSLQFDLNAGAVIGAEISQKEKRSIGPVTPGMELELVARVRRFLDGRANVIEEKDILAIPLQPAAGQLQIEHALPFGAVLQCDREWMAIQQTGQMLVLRLLDHGGIVAQCNLAPAPKVAPGERTDEKQFQLDIRRSLGEKLIEIVTAEEVNGITPHRVYRVTAVGTAEEIEMVWRYYLVSAPDGRQAAFVFTAEAAQLPRLGERDVELVKCLRFEALSEPKTAAPLSPREN